jgi:hypothetical protein
MMQTSSAGGLDSLDHVAQGSHRPLGDERCGRLHLIAPGQGQGARNGEVGGGNDEGCRPGGDDEGQGEDDRCGQGHGAEDGGDRCRTQEPSSLAGGLDLGRQLGTGELQLLTNEGLGLLRHLLKYLCDGLVGQVLRRGIPRGRGCGRGRRGGAIGGDRVAPAGAHLQVCCQSL